VSYRQPTGQLLITWCQQGLELRDVWSTAYVNDLPDSAFIYIQPGGTKTGGKTDGAHRYFPYKDASGKIDVPHLKNAIARIPQASTLSADERAQAMKKAKALVAAHPDIGGGTTSEYQGTAGSGRSRRFAGTMPEELMGLQTRTYEFAVELREAGDGRTLCGVAVPYGSTTNIPGGLERFMPGAFAAQIGSGNVGRVKFFDNHDDAIAGRHPIGKTSLLRERSDGLYGEWPLYQTAKGNDALTLVREGAVTGLSIGFKALDGGTRRGADGAYERHAAHLDHVVLTSQPAYVTAGVMAVRTTATPLGAYRRDLFRARAILDRVAAGL
jgi:HK97 family phage prohead protease